MASNDLGNRLATLRRQAGLSQSELAKKLNVSNKLISRWECGGAIPSLPYLQDYSRIFNLSLDALCDDYTETARRLAAERQANSTKLLTAVLYVLAILPLAISIISHSFLQETIPLHYNSAGAIDRFGSKNELLLLGAVLSAVTTVLLLSINGVCRKLPTKSTSKIVILSTLGVMAVGYIAIQLFATITGFRFAPTVPENAMPKPDPISVSCACASLLFSFIGLFLPLAKQNMLFGIRIPTTLSDADNWMKTHRLASVSFPLLGFIGALCCTLTSGLASLLLFFLFMATAAAIPTAYSVFLARKKQKNN